MKKNPSKILIAINIAIFLFGIVSICESYRYACSKQLSTICFCTVDSTNQKPKKMGIYQEGTTEDTIDFDSIDIKKMNPVGTFYSAEDMSSFVLYRNNVDENKTVSLGFLFIGYVCIVASIFLFISQKTDLKFNFKSISFESFHVFALFIPLSIMVVLALIWNFTKIISPILVLKIYGFSQCLFIALWFGQKLWMHKNKKLDQENYLVLDWCSTIPVVFLTFVWVIYDISYIKGFFACVLVEFMVVQVFVKIYQIDDLKRSKGSGRLPG
ncbi:hypothetical protein [Butyrivibrio fibrisolvens]|uniref:hypothetical protein n=1 Tax=Butyrivibrio fibrisolvens TaxID=831 RepID=UPI000406B5A9|nr:hypothetical protein [Butyrivibrio fibrisolvens]